MSQFRIPKNPKASFRKVEPPKYVPIEKTKARAFNADVLGFANSPYASIYENPNKAIEREWPSKIRDARLLERNPFVSNYLDLVETYVIGDTGIVLDPRITDDSGDLNTAVNDEIKTKFEAWAETPGVDGLKTWLEIQQIVMRNVALDGECLVRLYYGDDLQLQIVDATLLDHTFNAVNGVNGNQIIQGVEFNRMKPVAYYVWNKFQSDYAGKNDKRERQRVECADLIHVFFDPKGYLVRGVTWLDPIMSTAARLEEYMDANLMACQAAARAPLVLERSADSVHNQFALPGMDGEALPASAGVDVAQMAMQLDSFTVIDLPEGLTLKNTPIGFPNNGFDSQLKTYLRACAAALNVTYHALTADTSDQNFSSGKLGTIQQRDHWMNKSRWLINVFHKRVYKAWLKWNLETGRLNLPTIDPDDYSAINWRAAAARWLDPVKEMQAYRDGIREGLYTRTQVAHEMGGNFADNMAQLKLEKQMFEDAGIPYPLNDKGTAPDVNKNGQPEGTQPTTPPQKN